MRLPFITHLTLSCLLFLPYPSGHNVRPQRYWGNYVGFVPCKVYGRNSYTYMEFMFYTMTPGISSLKRSAEIRR